MLGPKISSQLFALKVGIVKPFWYVFCLIVNLVLPRVTLLGVDLNKRHANLILQEFHCAIA